MTISIVPYKDFHVSDVIKFNGRLNAASAGFNLPEVANAYELKPDQSERIYQEHFVAIEESKSGTEQIATNTNGQIRGGYILKTQFIHSNASSLDSNSQIKIANLQLPLSEGIINPKYSMTGVQIVLDAIKKQPYLYCLGMGGIVRPLPLMLKKLGWHTELVPFFFKINHAEAFLRETVFIRQNSKMKFAADFARYTMLGRIVANLHNLGTKVMVIANRILESRSIKSPITISEEPTFGKWADEIWEKAVKSNQYAFLCERSSHTLNQMYQNQNRGYIRLLFKDKEGNPVGFALVLATKLNNHRQFGNLYLGSIADCLSIPDHEDECIQNATRFLERKGVDIIVSNQSHKAWKKALRSTGFITGPSNYGFACSKPFAKLFSNLEECHLNRGDGDGPINL